MRGRVWLLIAGVFLSGCGMDASNVCPTVKAYSRDLQTRAADELDALPAESVLPIFLGDYAVMRAELRAGGC